MLRSQPRTVLILLIIVILSTCINPYIPKIAGYDSLLVVDGLVTNLNTSYTVKLSRTFRDINSDPAGVSNATVYIKDDSGNTFHLLDKGNGIYKTDSLEFTGNIGRKYILYLMTQDGNEYFSDSCPMRPVPDIDSIYFEKDQQFVKNQTQKLEGISIYLDSKTGDKDQFYRWDFEETWKFKIKWPPMYTYINDTTIIPYLSVPKVTCWKESKSNSILIGSVASDPTGRVTKQPITFIPSDQSDRLTIEYSILIKQYSISENDYKFLNNLNKLNETSGDIFVTTPYPVTSNIHSANNPKENVLGYFMVSAVKQKRKFISHNDIVKMNLPPYQSPCKRVEADIFPWTYNTSWDNLYKLFCIDNDWIFIEPKYNQVTNLLDKLVFVRPECADCEYTGTMKKPDFWVDN